MIFDSHAHYDDEAFDEDRESLLSSMKENGITAIVNVGASLESCRSSLKLAENYDFIYGAVGVHPSDTGELNEENYLELCKMMDHEKAVAVGEIGLDYYWDEPERQIQKKWFVRQLHTAMEKGKPLIIHSRDAAADTLDIMKAEKVWDCGGVIHCFSYSVEMAREYLNKGYYIGIGGVLTFNNAKKLKEVSGMDRIFFTNSGAEAIEGAIKAARKYAYLKDGMTDHEIIAMEHSFHGRTMGALSVTGNPHYREAFEPLIGNVKFADLNDFDSVLRQVNEKTCAIMFETIQGEGGIHPATKEFMEQVKIDRINELAKLAKQRELTPAEAEERAALRKEFLADFKKNLTDTLDNTYIVDEKGNKVKLEKKN